MTDPITPVLSHLRVTWGGTLGNPAQDVWANGIAFRITDEPPSADELQAICVLAAPIITTLITGVVPAVSPAVALNWVKAVWVLNSGKQRDVNTAMYEFPAGEVPRGQGAPVPWFQTYAVTLRTALSRGRGHAGRIFPPPSGPPPENVTPYAALAFATNQATNYANRISEIGTAIFSALNQPPEVPHRFVHPVVVSRKSDRQPTPLLTDIITAVVDRVADVQHRRTNRVERSEGAEVPLS